MEYTEKEIEKALKEILGNLGRYFQEKGYSIKLKDINEACLKFAIMKGEEMVAAIQFMDLAGKLCLGIGGERAVEKLIKDQLLAMGYTISPEDEDMPAGALFNYPLIEEGKNKCSCGHKIRFLIYGETITPHGHVPIDKIEGMPEEVLKFLTNCGMTHGKCIDVNAGVFEVSYFSPDFCTGWQLLRGQGVKGEGWSAV